MKRILFGAPLLLGLALLAASANAQTNYKETFNTALSGANEVPAVSPEMATGTASFMVRADESAIDYTLDLTSAEPLTAAHLHCAPAGANGPVIVPLSLGTMGTTSAPIATSTATTTVATTTAAAATSTMMTAHATSTIIGANLTDNCPGIETLPHLIQAMREGRIYANAHSVPHPDGVARGQLSLGGGISMPTGVGTTTSTSSPSAIRAEIMNLLNQIRELQNRLIEILGGLSAL